MPKKATRYQGERKERFTIALTPTAADRLDEMAAAQGISRSEFIEKVGRGTFSVTFTPDAMGECLAS